MKAETVSKIFSNDVLIKKVILYVIGIVVVFIVLRYLYKKVGSLLVTDPTLELSQDNVIEEDLTYSNLEYIAMSESLYNAFDVSAFFGWGTNEDVIYRIFAGLKTESDYYALYNAYGIRDKRNLVQALFFDLRESEIEVVRNSLAQINITF